MSYGPTIKTAMQGKMKCGACSQPLRDHPGLGPCPYWEAGLIDMDKYIEERNKRTRRMK